MKSNLTNILISAKANKAIEVYINALSSPTIKTNHQLVTLDKFEITTHDLKNYIDELLTKKEQHKLNTEGFIKTAIFISAVGHVRLVILVAINTLDITIKMHPKHPPNLLDILFPIMENDYSRKIITEQKNGVLFVSGKHGSGLTTSLASIIQYINQHHSCSIITISRQIEFSFTNQKSFIIPMTLGDDSEIKCLIDFANQFNIIVIDELDNEQMIQGLLNVARKSNSLIIAGIHHENVITLFETLISNSLMSRATTLEQISNWYLGTVEQCLVTTPQQNKILAYHCVVGTPSVKNMIREDKLPMIYAATQTGSKFGMMTKDHYLSKLVEIKCISLREADKHATSGIFEKNE